MKKSIYLIGALLMCLATVSCSNDDFVWGDTSYARIVGPEIWTLGTDSMSFTFSTQNMDTKEFVVNATIQVQGKVADVDRTVTLKVDASRSTAPQGSWESPEKVVLAANEHEVLLPITIYRTDELTEKDYRLCIAIDDSGDLKKGVSSASSLTIIWNDKIVRPSNWDDLEEFFGVYSEVKYRFIISTLGIATFPYGQDEFTWGKMWNFRATMIEALEEYNSDPSNPDRPLKDENGGIVSFI